MSLRILFGRGTVVACAVGMMALGSTACKASLKVGTEEPAPEPVAEPMPEPEPEPEPAPEPAPEPEVKVELPGPIRFKSGTAQLEAASDVPLNVVLEYLKAKTEITKMRIEGHTDSDDTNARNMDLSKRRAMAAAQWLIAKGIDCNRLIAVGFGEEKLVKDPDPTPEDKAENRRVDFIPAERKGKAIANRPIDGGEPGQTAGDACKK
jgi:OOP family OmpA-OmpF porin